MVRFTLTGQYVAAKTSLDLLVEKARAFPEYINLGQVK
jgi:hypothetical protein